MYLRLNCIKLTSALGGFIKHSAIKPLFEDEDTPEVCAMVISVAIDILKAYWRNLGS